MPRRQHLHHQVLNALLNRSSESYLARIVHHAAQAGDAASVLKYAPLAAKQAATFNAHRESAAHYQTALQYADLIAPRECAVLWESRSYECFLSGQNDEAFKARQKALEIWQQLEDKIRQGDNLRWMSRISWFLRNRADAESYSNEAVATLEQQPPSPELAMAYSNRSQLHMLADQIQEAVEWGSRAIELAKKWIDYDNATKLMSDQQAVYGQAYATSIEKPCCCKCWHYFVNEGIAKKMIRDGAFNAQQIADYWDSSDICGA